LFHRRNILVDSQLCVGGCGAIESVDHIFLCCDIFFVDLVSGVALVRLQFDPSGAFFESPNSVQSFMSFS
jgi:hypothetical protein